MEKQAKELQVISAFEFAIREAANKHSGTTEHTEGFRPRTRAEDNERLNQDLRQQLSRMQIVHPDGTREDLIQDEPDRKDERTTLSWPNGTTAKVWPDRLP